jgi:Arc/MetJ-type ribon-helix-helix transcriptional regulator
MGKPAKSVTYWNIPIPKSLDRAVEKAVKIGMYSTKSDLVRDAVRLVLKELNVKETEETEA